MNGPSWALGWALFISTPAILAVVFWLWDLVAAVEAEGK